MLKQEVGTRSWHGKSVTPHERIHVLIKKKLEVIRFHSSLHLDTGGHTKETAVGTAGGRSSAEAESRHLEHGLSRLQSSEQWPCLVYPTLSKVICGSSLS